MRLSIAFHIHQYYRSNFARLTANYGFGEAQPCQKATAYFQSFTDALFNRRAAEAARGGHQFRTEDACVNVLARQMAAPISANNPFLFDREREPDSGISGG